MKWGKKVIREKGRELVREGKVMATIHRSGSYTVAQVYVSLSIDPSDIHKYCAVGVSKVRLDLDVFDGPLGVRIAIGRALKRIILAILDGEELWDEFVFLEEDVTTPYGVIQGTLLIDSGQEKKR